MKKRNSSAARGAVILVLFAGLLWLGRQWKAKIQPGSQPEVVEGSGHAPAPSETSPMKDIEPAPRSPETNNIGTPPIAAADAPVSNAGSNAAPARLELVWIAPGSFMMGRPDANENNRPHEGPQTYVTITEGFWLGKYEVTVGQYLGIAGGDWPRGYQHWKLTDPNFPMKELRWEDATNFCGLLTERERQSGRLPEGYVYRLPTEAEWEYACRAGTTNRFSFGDDDSYPLMDPYAWFYENSGGRPHPVGGKKPNPWGLYDMHGNVAEWCFDDVGDQHLPGGSVLNPVGVPGNHTVRGGSWNVLRTRALESGSRLHQRHPGYSLSHSGFRVALARPLPLE